VGTPVASLRGVKLEFGNVRAIDGLDLDVRPARSRPELPKRQEEDHDPEREISGYMCETGT